MTSLLQRAVANAQNPVKQRQPKAATALFPHNAVYAPLEQEDAAAAAAAEESERPMLSSQDTLESSSQPSEEVITNNELLLDKTKTTIPQTLIHLLKGYVRWSLSSLYMRFEFMYDFPFLIDSHIPLL